MNQSLKNRINLAIDKYLKKEDFNLVKLVNGDEIQESEICRCAEVLEWSSLIKHKVLSEAFLQKYRYRLNWQTVSKYQTLSEEFIERYQKDVDWISISRYQRLSFSFLEKFSDKLDFDELRLSRQYNEEMIVELERLSESQDENFYDIPDHFESDY